MSVKSIDKNYDALTITALAEFEAAPERVWELCTTAGGRCSRSTRRDDMPISDVTVTFTARDGGTVVEVVTAFADREQMEEQISTGAIDGAACAMSQMDVILADA